MRDAQVLPLVLAIGVFQMPYLQRVEIRLLQRHVRSSTRTPMTVYRCCKYARAEHLPNSRAMALCCESDDTSISSTSGYHLHTHAHARDWRLRENTWI